ncbi:hypothetical protein J437_LFUL012431 [Ladona fulva]|uniref:Uncharacterized protein n=1 Tax=Ladona fulva TaxID=123851 RepID=A0A8K0P4B3_LADFU|nr:hypothetical protein J437_LFUL012431 [Ladona fulva]
MIGVEATEKIFVLFKKHYEKYINISQKYEEARNIAYYLEEKYHEVKHFVADVVMLEKILRRVEVGVRHLFARMHFSPLCLLAEKAFAREGMFAEHGYRIHPSPVR